MKRYLYIAGIVVLLVCIGIASKYYFDERDDVFPQNKNGDLTTLTVGEDFRYVRTTEKAYCVSLGEYSKDALLMARYDKLEMISRETGEIKEIKPENMNTCEVVGGPASFANKKKWNPTGLYYDRRTNLLYIANYNGHNILVGRITDSETFFVEKMIVAEGLTSPENVAVNEVGNRIAVADYDGNSLFLFDDKGNMLWRKEVPLAHGVEISDSSVYGTSLSTREIIQFDYDGNEIRRVGHCANRGVNAYMWPTALELYKGKLIVTDAHTGRLTVLNEKLKYETALGANGPYVTNFSYPYTAIGAEDKIYVADTFANRILEMDLSGNLLKQFSKEVPRMQLRGSSPYVPQYPYDLAYLFERQKEVPQSFFCEGYSSDMDVVAGFSSFWLIQGCNKIQIPLVVYPSNATWLNRFFRNNYFYNMWSCKVSAKNHIYYVFGSPQSATFLFFCSDVDFVGIIRFGKHNTYYIDGEFIGDQEYWKVFLSDMGMLTDTFANQIEEGKTRYQAYKDTFVSYYYKKKLPVDITPEEDFDAWLAFQCTQSENGKSLFEAIKQGTATTDDYKSYMDECYREPSKHSVFERLLFRTFVGNRNNKMNIE